jgi:hypothetical protein
LFWLPQRTAAQGQPIVDDECFFVEETSCDVEGIAAILESTNSAEIDTYVATSIDNEDLLEEGFDEAFVDGLLFKDDIQIDEAEGDDEGDGLAEAEMADPVSPASVYTLEGDSYLIDDDDDFDFVGSAFVEVSSSTPESSNFSPTFGYVGKSGSITVTGSNLVDPFTGVVTPSFGSGSGATLSFQGGNSNQISLSYTLAQNASTGARSIVLQDRFGIGTSTQTFNVGDPPPVAASVNPDVWQAGTTIPITITGSGFGTSPTVTVTGMGVTIQVGTVSDTNISATIIVASSAPNESATIQIQSNGYNGTMFVDAFTGESSVTTLNATVVQAVAPVPKIQLYGTVITTPQAVVVGQEMALSVSVTLPEGQSFATQTWSMSEGFAVGGYTNTAGSIPPDTTGGKVKPLPALTSNSTTMTPLPLTFYWADSGGSSRTIGYSYTLTNGEGSSAIATFNVDAPSGVTLQVTQSAVNILLPLGASQPTLVEGASGVAGLNLFASASHLPAGGAYQWVQLIQEDVVKIDSNLGLLTCPAFPSSSAPELDNSYPYGNGFAGTVTSTGGITNNGANDSPAFALQPRQGEQARSFNANMYLMWMPHVLNGCVDGNACTIPVPLGSIQSQFAGDGINTQNESISPPSPSVFPLWIKNAATDSNAGFVQASSFPTWMGATSNNGQRQCTVN